MPLDLQGSGHLLRKGPAGRGRCRAPARRRLRRGGGHRPVRLGASGARAGISTQTSQGAILAVPPDYSAHVHTFRLLQGWPATRRRGPRPADGSDAPGQARGHGQAAASPERAAPISYKVTGVGLITAPDQVFQPLNPLLGPAPGAAAAERRDHAHENLRHGRSRPACRRSPRAPSGASAQPGSQTGTQWQVQAQLDRGPLASGSPSHGAISGRPRPCNRIESSLPGQVQFVDNLSDSLNTAAGDALYAETLFLLLAVPGALIALGLAYLAALGTSERDRRDLALLRARGARRRDLLKLAAVESVMLGLAAGIARLRARFRAVQLARRAAAPISTFWRGARHRARRAVGLAIAGVGGGSTGGTREALTAEVSEGRAARPRAIGARLAASTTSTSSALALSGLIYWLTIRTGFSAVVSPDSNPTLSLSVYMFFGPALLWIGATLLLVRLRGRFAGAPWRAARLVGRDSLCAMPRLASPGRRAAARQSRSRRDRPAAGLRASASASSPRPTTSRRRSMRSSPWGPTSPSARRLASPGRTNLASTVASVPGVAATTRCQPRLRLRRARPAGHLRHRPGDACAKATTLRDSYFLGGSADADDRAGSRSTPDGILVSLETITDYSLHPGRPVAAARARPAHRPVPHRAVPRRRRRSRSSPRRRGTPSWSRTRRYLDAAHTLGPERRLREDERRARRRSPRRVAAATAPLRHRASRTSTSRPPRRSARSRPSICTGISQHRGGLRDRARRRRDGAVRLSRASPSAAMSSRRWRRSARPCGEVGGLPLERGGASCSIAALALAAGLGWLLARDARRDADPRLRPAAGPPGDPVGLSRLALRASRSLAAIVGSTVAQRAIGRLPLGRDPPGALRNARDT